MVGNQAFWQKTISVEPVARMMDIQAIRRYHFQIALLATWSNRNGKVEPGDRQGHTTTIQK